MFTLLKFEKLEAFLRALRKFLNIDFRFSFLPPTSPRVVHQCTSDFKKTPYISHNSLKIEARISRESFRMKNSCLLLNVPEHDSLEIFLVKFSFFFSLKADNKVKRKLRINFGESDMKAIAYLC